MGIADRNDRSVSKILAYILANRDRNQPITRKWRIQVMQISYLLPHRTIDFCGAAI
jgi:hypothetical protein